MRVYRSVAHRFNRRDGSDGHRAKRHAWYMTTCSVALASAGGMWSDVVVLAVWLSVVEARGTLWPLWALGPHFSFNIYPCLPAPSRRKRPPLTENSNTLGPGRCAGESGATRAEAARAHHGRLRGADGGRALHRRPTSRRTREAAARPGRAPEAGARIWSTRNGLNATGSRARRPSEAGASERLVRV